MATDNLSQLGKTLKRTQDELVFTERRIAENIPEIERLRDQFGITFPFIQEFWIYSEPRKHSAWISLRFYEPFDPNAAVFTVDIPIAITQTGLSVGLAGKVGSQDIWYPLAYFGDLNFAGADYSVVFDIQTYLTNTSEYKVSFREGEVNVTDITTIGSSTILVPVTAAKLLIPPNLIIHDVYVYGKVTSVDVSGWLYYETATLFRDGYLYSPRLIDI